MDKGASSYRLFLQGNDQGFVEIVESYENGLILFLSNFINDRHLAEEVADEVFLKLYEDKPRFKGKCSFKTWLYAIGRNMAVNYVKKNRRSAISSFDDYFYLSDEIDIESEYIKSEEAVELHKAINRLKKDYSQVLYLVFFEELNNSEVAKIMGKSSRQISDLIYRAKNALKKELKKEVLHERSKE